MWYSSAAAFLRCAVGSAGREAGAEFRQEELPPNAENMPKLSRFFPNPDVTLRFGDKVLAAANRRTIPPVIVPRQQKPTNHHPGYHTHINPCRGYFSLLSFPLIFLSLFPLYHRTLTSTSHLSVVTSINHVYRASARNLPCPRHFCR